MRVAFPTLGHVPTQISGYTRSRLRLTIAPVIARAIFATLYFWCYVFSYTMFLPEQYDSWGLGQQIDVVSNITFVLWGAAVVPALFIRTSIKWVTDFFIYIQYFLIYVPSLWVAFNSTRPNVNWNDAIALDVTLFASMMLMVLASRLRPRGGHQTTHLLGSHIVPLTIISLLMFAFISSSLGWRFSLLGFDAIYELRHDVGEALAESSAGRLAGYVFTWLNGALLPILFSVGLFRRKWHLMGIVAALYVGLYALWGSKASLLAPLAIMLVSWLYRRFEGRHLAAFTVFFCVMLTMPFTFMFLDNMFLSSWYSYIVLQRTFNSSALLIPQYLDFINSHAFTYGSHITGISALISYPFDMDVPRMVGLYQYGGPMTANANYWAADGVASFGLLGIPAISIVAATVFYGIDYRLRRLPLAFCIPCMTFMVSNLIDTSLFTTLVSGGLIVILIILPMMFRRPTRQS